MSFHAITSAQHKPAIGLCMDAASSTKLAPLVQALAEFATPVAPEANQVVQGRLVSSVHAPTAHLVLDHPEVPAAVVIHHQDDLEHEIAQAARLLITLAATGRPSANWPENKMPEDAKPEDERPESGLAHTHTAAVQPAVKVLWLSPNPLPEPLPLPVSVPQREALRKRFGLPETLVISVGRPGAPNWGGAELETALRVASVVVASGDVVARAMALAAPVVTDASTANALGATHNKHVLVAEAHEMNTVAEVLANQTKRTGQTRPASQGQPRNQTALLGTTARQLIKASQPRSVAKAMVEHFGLMVASMWPSAVNARFSARLGELGTPPGHPIESQFEARMRGLHMQIQAGGL
ncbi:MAG: hypothetical protein WC184_08345 [Acidimicrobiia bacterium]